MDAREFDRRIKRRIKETADENPVVEVLMVVCLMGVFVAVYIWRM